MKPTTGLRMLSFNQRAASASIPPPISPIMMIPCVSGSFINNSTASFVVVPIIGSPPIPIAVVIPIPAFTTWSAASYVNVPDFETIPMFPFLKMKPGIIPTLASSAVITPGQFGPINRQSLSLIYSLAVTMSCTGIPSVIQMMVLIPASAASIIASAAKAGGTKMIETSAPALVTASATVLKTGLSK